LFGLAQFSPHQARVFQPISVNGGFSIDGSYRYMEGTTNSIYNIQKSPLLSGGIFINTRSYFYHPDFISLDIGGEYNPGLQQDDYLIIPDRSETRTYKSFNGKIEFFRGKKITLDAYVQYNDNFSNREGLTNIMSGNKRFGGSFLWSQKYAPIELFYEKGISDQEELGTIRSFKYYKEQYKGKISKSFSFRDYTEFIYFHDDFRSEEMSYNNSRNISDNFKLKNKVYFDDQKRYSINSMIYSIKQVGTMAFNRFHLNENLSLNFPVNLTLSGNYSYLSSQYVENKSKQHSLKSVLSHKLFKSLTTSLIYEYYNSSQYSYKDVSNRIGIDMIYTKNIPIGKLLFGINYNRSIINNVSRGYQLQVYDEKHILIDGEIHLLERPNAIIETIVVKDNSGTIIYQLGFDYILLELNTYIQIQRIPGGQIPNNGPVLVDYSILQEGSYQYHATNSGIQARLILFNKLIELYYKRFQQSFSNLVNTENVTLNYFIRNTYGINLEYKFASMGVELEKYNSSITPFNLWSYYFRIQGNAKGKLIYSLNCSYRDYHLLYNNTFQKYADVTGNVIYSFNSKAKLSLELGYRKQIGNGIDLDLLTCQLEFNLNYRDFSINSGVHLYRKIYLADDLNYSNVYIKLIRKFNWYKK